MNAAHIDDSDDLDAVVADYLCRADGGEVVGRAHFLNAHPEVANELKEFFASEDWLRRLIQRSRGYQTTAR